MTLLRSIAICLLMPIAVVAQQDWDKLDVIGGSNPTLRYGFYTETNGRVQMGRYYFIDDGEDLRVTLAPYGRTPVVLPVRSINRSNGELVLGWDGRPGRTCVLERQSHHLFLGNCNEALLVLPISIRVANERDVEWMGTHFPVSSEDIAILEEAKRILLEQSQRNREGDRNCDDDLANSNFSVFCALYFASVDVTGVYRHRRPAMQTVRKEAARRYPGEYPHILRDVNNRADISDSDLIEVLDSVRAQLLSELNPQHRRQ
ncbi:hypothetical protein R0135_06535 [Congregibacter variabilis]|uniref:DUF4369 domain-containing protein n=1 Tax=Congregibacter variabilis TaxID=3081200 RepID=A0ABZ0I6Z7_9GAMM|nr:hypothetical protein R0135_06535 [Congregibacter sp. IMCC43200]